jgi:hypothetical protein
MNTIGQIGYEKFTPQIALGYPNKCFATFTKETAIPKNGWKPQNVERRKTWKVFIIIVIIILIMQATSIWKQDIKVNIWAQVGWQLGEEKVPQWGIS